MMFCSEYKPGLVASSLGGTGQVATDSPLASLFSSATPPPTKRARKRQQNTKPVSWERPAKVHKSETQISAPSPTKPPKKKHKKKEENAVLLARESSLRNADDGEKIPAKRKRKLAADVPPGKSAVTMATEVSPAKQQKQKQKSLVHVSQIQSNKVRKDAHKDKKSEHIGREKQREGRRKKVEKLQRTVFVGNLPTSVTRTKTLKKLFRKYGEIESLRFRCAAPADLKLPKRAVVIKQEFHPDRDSINAYVVFKEKQAAQNALQLNGEEVGGHHVRVDLAALSKKHDHKKSVFVGNLPFDTEEEALRRHFEECGKVQNVRIIRDGATGIGKGFGYILFEDATAVGFALKLNEHKFGGRKLRVTRSVKKQKDNADTDKSATGRPQHHSKHPSNKPWTSFQGAASKRGKQDKKKFKSHKSKESKGRSKNNKMDSTKLNLKQPEEKTKAPKKLKSKKTKTSNVKKKTKKEKKKKDNK